MIKHSILAAFVALTTFACTAQSTDSEPEQQKAPEENVEAVSSEMKMGDTGPHGNNNCLCTMECNKDHNCIEICRGEGCR